MSHGKIWGSGASALILTTLFAAGVSAQTIPLVMIGATEEPVAEHADQIEFNEMVELGLGYDAFILAFEEGDELFEAEFNALDGGGANVGDGLRFTRLPRADLKGAGEWANHTPMRATGPNGQSCIGCHNKPFPDGAGAASSNVTRDPLHSKNPRKMITRNTAHMFGIGALQVLAEEMTQTLHGIVDAAVDDFCATGTPVTTDLVAKGVFYGTVTVQPDDDAGGPGNGNGNGNDNGGACNPRVIIAAEGISDDLVVRPYQWKGSEPTMRAFNVGALHNEIGMQPVETTGVGVDGDGDGVVDEFGVGDVTALTIYLAAQPRPITKAELVLVGLEEYAPGEEASITAGELVFEDIGCVSCHMSSLVADNPIFSEPSQYPTHQPNPLPAGLDPASAITFDLTTDHPDNLFTLADGTEVHLGSFEANAAGGAIVRLYGDLKQHDMGPGLAESIDEIGNGAATFMTKELWGVGDTGPYLHDGRASTLTEAILWHGGEAQASRDAFVALSDVERQQVVDFLNSLRTLLHE